jgi:tetratricopeptide (TPR) repeat protein
MFMDRPYLPAGKNEYSEIKAVSKVMQIIPKEYQSMCIYLVLALTTIAVFWQVSTYDFVNYDDPAYVYENTNIQAGITFKAIKWAFTTGYIGNWHPLTWLSYMVDWQLFGSKPAGYHLTNLIFHIANTLLLLNVLKQMTHRIWPSAFVAALFALHPLHVESVAWISERKDVLSAFFWMLTMWAYLRYVKQPSVTGYLLTLLSFVLGLMAKPMLVTLPFVLLLLDYWPLARIPSGQALNNSGSRRIFYYLIREKIPFFILSVVSSIVTLAVQRGAMVPITLAPPKYRIYNALVCYVEYIRKMIWPSRLAVYYQHPGTNVSILYTLISTVLLLVVTIIILRLAKDRRYLVTGWFWYLGTLVPVIGLVQVGGQALADRYSYIPLTGLFIIIAWGVPDLLVNWRYKKIALILLSLLIISASSICTHFQLRHWKNSLTLFQHTLDVTEDNYVVHIHIAEYLCEQNRLDEAIEEYKKCLQIIPDDTDALNNLGIALGKQGKYDQAIERFNEALRIKPNLASAHTNMSYALAFQGKLDDAAAHLAEALRLDPHFAKAHYYLGLVMGQKGKIKEAITHIEDALRLAPDRVEPMNDLAWLLAASKQTSVHNPDKAVRLAQRACKLTNYKKPDLLDTLAVAYAAAGDFSKAIETAEKALELCQSPEQKTLKEEIENRLVLYKAGKPYIETQ